MTSINQWLRDHPRSSKYGAPQGQRNTICHVVLDEIRDKTVDRSINVDGRIVLAKKSSRPIYIERLVVEDGDYDLSGTYWGFGPDSKSVWCGYTLDESSGTHDSGIRVFVRASSFDEAKAELEEKLRDAIGDPHFGFEFKGPGESAIYGEMLARLNSMVDSYLETARFTDMGPDSDIPEHLPFSDRAKFDAALDILNFIDNARSDENSRVNNTQTITWTLLIETLGSGKMALEQMASDLWYSRNGHGVGFWERGLGPLGDRLHTLAEDMGTRSVYTNDNEIVEIE